MGVFQISSFTNAGQVEIKPGLISQIRVSIAVGIELYEQGEFAFCDYLIFECHSMKITTREITAQTQSLRHKFVPVLRPLRLNAKNIRLLLRIVRVIVHLGIIIFVNIKITKKLLIFINLLTHNLTLIFIPNFHQENSDFLFKSVRSSSWSQNRVNFIKIHLRINNLKILANDFLSKTSCIIFSYRFQEVLLTKMHFYYLRC